MVCGRETQIATKPSYLITHNSERERGANACPWVPLHGVYPVFVDVECMLCIIKVLFYQEGLLACQGLYLLSFAKPMNMGSSSLQQGVVGETMEVQEQKLNIALGMQLRRRRRQAGSTSMGMCSGHPPAQPLLRMRGHRHPDVCPDPLHLRPGPHRHVLPLQPRGPAHLLCGAFSSSPLPSPKRCS